MRWAAAAIVLPVTFVLAACQPARPKGPNAAGLVRLPCGGGALRPNGVLNCVDERNYVTPPALAALQQAAQTVRTAYPGAAVRYMEASWASGKRPMPPHLSHGDGREVDLALYYETARGSPLGRTPTLDPLGYGAFEPPRTEAERVCKDGALGANDAPDPPKTRAWRLDETRTRLLLKTLTADPRVRRVFIEPHLKARLGFGGDDKVRFAGCQAARHDDHLHVDFF